MISKLYQGIDDHHRVAQVKTATGMITRPVTKLYPLEINCEDLAGDQGATSEPISQSIPEQVIPGHNDGNSHMVRRAAQGSQQLWRSLIDKGDI